mgnify:CR=1 FL=1
MSLSVQRPAVSSPEAPSGISVKTFFEEQLSSSPVAFVPKNYEFSGDPKKKLGEEAEKKVFDMVGHAGRDIPGIQIVCFHGVRVIAGSPIILREVDFCLFVTYQGRHYIVIKEVKCNVNPESSRATSKKAISQLRTFEDMLARELNVLTDKLHIHAVWPNMPETEPCPSCPGSHPSLYERPAACQQAGTQRRANPEPPGFHVFKDRFENGEFSKWMKGIISDPTTAVDPSTYDSVLDFVARHCVGVLYDETVKSFCILGDDQAKLVNSKEQPLTKPTIVYGLGGTGKTISIMARIQRISGKLNASCRALYVCFEDNATAMVKRKLGACKVDLAHIIFANFSSFPHNLSGIAQDEKVLDNLVSLGYRYIYLDSAEDLGVDWVNRLLESVLKPVQDSNHKTSKTSLSSQIFGDFWITMDPYQGLKDTHSLVRGFQNQIEWQGNLVDSNLLKKGFKRNKFIKLKECFRMPRTAIEHLDRENILPTNDLPRAQDVNSMGVKVEDISLPGSYTIQWLADQLADRLYKKVMLRGIHPGHCAILFHHEAMADLFPSSEGGFSAFLQGANAELRSMSVGRQAGHMLQMTEDVAESILFGCHTTLSSTSATALVSFPLHSQVGSISAPKDTAEYKTEQHNEVTF